MKNLVLMLVLLISFISCNSISKTSKTKANKVVETSQDTVRISNDSIEYEVIIIEPGFNSWLQSIAKPEGYYSKSFLESRNYIFVTEWNNRVNQPHRYNPNLYQLRIDYSPHIDYGYEVNYKLYNYFIYFQLHYKQQLSGFIPRI